MINRHIFFISQFLINSIPFFRSLSSGQAKMLHVVKRGAVKQLVGYHSKVDSELGHIKKFAAGKTSAVLDMAKDLTKAASDASMAKMTDALFNYKVGKLTALNCSAK